MITVETILKTSEEQIIPFAKRKKKLKIKHKLQTKQKF